MFRTEDLAVSEFRSVCRSWFRGGVGCWMLLDVGLQALFGFRVKVNTRG